MQKQSPIIVAINVILGVVIIGTIIALINVKSNATPHTWAQAKATRATVSCLAADSKLAIPSNVHSNIETSALSYLYDVPAGTNVDVELATYLPTSVTGSDHYPAKYGSYNFAMTKNESGWHFSDFKHCR